MTPKTAKIMALEKKNQELMVQEKKHDELMKKGAAAIHNMRVAGEAAPSDLGRDVINNTLQAGAAAPSDLGHDVSDVFNNTRVTGVAGAVIDNTGVAVIDSTRVAGAAAPSQLMHDGPPYTQVETEPAPAASQVVPADGGNDNMSIAVLSAWLESEMKKFRWSMSSTITEKKIKTVGGR